MTCYEAIKILRTEQKCIIRQNGAMCDNKRDCANCDLCLESKMIIDAFNIAVKSIEKQIQKKPNEGEYKFFPVCPNCDRQREAHRNYYWDHKDEIIEKRLKKRDLSRA